MRGFFITGTDTDAGKTYVSCLLLAWLASRGERALGLKPVCSGSRDDPQALLEAGSFSNSLTVEDVNPSFFSSPLAPLVASRIEGQGMSTAELVEFCRTKPAEVGASFTLVEGVGGWEVPLSDLGHQAEFAEGLGVPILLVVANRLGALNHAILSIAAIRARGLEVAGILLNHLEDELDLASITNKEMLPELTGVPIVAEILHDYTQLIAEEELESLCS